MKGVLSRIKYKILLVLTGSMLVFFMFSNAVSLSTKAEPGELSESGSEAPTDEVQMADFESSDPPAENPPAENPPAEQPAEETPVMDTVNDDAPVLIADENGDGAGNSSETDESGTGSGNSSNTDENGTGSDNSNNTDGNEPKEKTDGDNTENTSDENEDPEGKDNEDDEDPEAPKDDEEGEEGESDGEGEDEEKEEEEEEECTCTTHCTAAEFDETCPVCAENFNNCKCPEEEEEEEEEEELVCTCTRKCEEGAVELGCPLCSSDYTLCEGDDLQYAAYINYTIGGERKRARYITLADAIDDVSEIAGIVHGDGDSNYTPTIEIRDELSIATNITTTNAATYTIDMQGHRVDLESGVHIDFGDSNVTLMDSESSPIDYSESNARPGGITGDTGKLFSGTGNITFTSGYYSLSSGNILDGFDNVTLDGAYLLTSSGALANSVTTITVNGGFFIYDDVFSSNGDGSLNLPEQNVLSDMTITIDGYAVQGRGLTTAIFKVTLNLVGEPEYFYTTFAECFEGAKSLSSSNDGAKSIITINDPNIVNVAVSRNYALTSGAEGYSPVVEVDGINFIRGGQSESIYDDTLFSVNSGELILNNCSVNGYISESQVAVSSMITVESGATLTLIGNQDVGTSLTGNVGLYGATAGDPCAGVFVKNGGVIALQGFVTIANNVTYSESTNNLGETESTKINKNLYLDEVARINILGVMLRTETFLIGITTGVELTDGLEVGYLDSAYLSQLNDAGINIVDLTSFYSDTSAAYYFVYDFGTNTISLTKGSALLPEAGVLRLEFIILLIGLIGFILKNVDKFKERVEIERYITVMSVACLVLGGGLGIYHFYTENQIEAMNNEIVSKMFVQMDKEKSNENNVDIFDTVNVARDGEELIEEGDDQTKKESLVPADGREYIGIIEVQELGIRLPVLKNYTDADMKTTPCVYFGTRENDNLVIVGHNYDSQFGNFNKLDSSQEVNAILTLLDGTKYYYKSKSLENLNPNQIDEMLSGEWDMTLFTCSYSGEKRIALRFDLVR